MYFGSSAIVDFAFCAGMGVAIACCMATAFQATNEIDSLKIRDCFKNTLRVVVFILIGGAQLSIAAFIGGTKLMRDVDSVFGCVAGLLAAILLGVLFRRIRS